MPDAPTVQIEHSFARVRPEPTVMDDDRLTMYHVIVAGTGVRSSLLPDRRVAVNPPLFVGRGLLRGRIPEFVRERRGLHGRPE